MELTLQSAFSLAAFPGHASYFLLVLAMLMSSITTLRLLALGSGLAGFFYSAVILTDPVGAFWEIAFITANAAQLSLIAWRSRTVHFSDEDHQFYKTAIPLVPAALARQLINTGEWRDLDAGAELTRQDAAVETLTYVANGTVEIRIDGRPAAACRRGDFVGELGIFSDHPATATAVAVTPLRVLTFERQTLMRAQRRQPEFRLALDAAFNTNLRRKLTAANKLATTDPLTGIANRRSLFDAAGGEMQRARRYGDPFSIIMIDIDHFKQINDTIGHAGGDHVLTEIAGLCVQICRADLDVAGRVGGEEFAIIMPGTGVDGAFDFAERLRAAISAAAIVVEGKTVPVTASFGVAAFQAGDHTIADLFKRADDALYNAKAAGRNKVVVKVEQR